MYDQDRECYICDRCGCEIRDFKYKRRIIAIDDSKGKIFKIANEVCGKCYDEYLVEMNRFMNSAKERK